MSGPDGISTANVEQERFWNDVGGPLWVAAEEEIESHTGPFGAAAVDMAAPAKCEAVLDVGCGCGSTTLALARAVGEKGSVLGVDLSAPMLSRAKERASSNAASHVRFRRADVQTVDLGTHEFDLVFSRFGVMFFADPTEAFSNMRQALRPDGRLVFVCWQPPSANPWMAIVNRAASAIYSLDAPPHDAPGPFSFADPSRISSVLGVASFHDVEITAVERRMHLGAGDTVEHWIHQRLSMGPARALYLDEDEARQRMVRTQIAEQLAPYMADASDPTSGLDMEGAAWVVRALP